jgi:protein tyrosine/serine phosphatase
LCLGAGIVLVLVLGSLWGVAARGNGNGTAEKRVHVVVPGRLVRGAWQNPEVLRVLIAREGIKTIVTLTAINRDDPKYVSQAEVVKATGVAWYIIPMRGSRATLEQMAQAADVLADPKHQPVFFHCVAGHHRTNLTHAAYLIRHAGWSAEQAWRAVVELPWTRPYAAADQKDRTLIEEFARRQTSWPPCDEGTR